MFVCDKMADVDNSTISGFSRNLSLSISSLTASSISSILALLWLITSCHLVLWVNYHLSTTYSTLDFDRYKS